MVFQEPMTSLNPAFKVGDQIAESVRHHLGKSRKEAPRQGRRAARRGRHPPGVPPPRLLPARVLRRDAPAGDDRDGPRLQSRPADRRRTDDRPRRDDPGADRRPPAPAEPRSRDGRDVHHPRLRGRGRGRRRRHRDVRRPGDRVGRCVRAVRGTAAPVHRGPAARRALPRRRDRRRRRPRPARRPTEPDGVPPRVPVRAAVLVRHRPLPGRARRAGGGAAPIGSCAACAPAN